MAGFCGYGTLHYEIIKRDEFFDELSDYLVLKKNSAA
jgi:hypothetical protein